GLRPRSAQSTVSCAGSLDGQAHRRDGLNVSTMIERSRTSSEPYSTDDNGEATLEFVEGATQLSIHTLHPSYPPTTITWDTKRNDKIPAEFTFKAEPGVLLGGTVKDEDGNPVPHAAVAINFPAPYDQNAR